MKIVFEGQAKEIAALVLVVQERRHHTTQTNAFVQALRELQAKYQYRAEQGQP